MIPYPYRYSVRLGLYSFLRSRSLAATTTSEATTELGLEVTGGTALALLAGITSSVAVTFTATATTAATTALTVVTAHHAARGSVGALLLDVRLGDDLGGEVEPLAEVVETLRGEGVVVVLP